MSVRKEWIPHKFVASANPKSRADSCGRCPYPRDHDIHRQIKGRIDSGKMIGRALKKEAKIYDC